MRTRSRSKSFSTSYSPEPPFSLGEQQPQVQLQQSLEIHENYGDQNIEDLIRESIRDHLPENWRKLLVIHLKKSYDKAGSSSDATEVLIADHLQISIDKVRDCLGLYERDPAHFASLCTAVNSMQKVRKTAQRKRDIIHNEPPLPPQRRTWLLEEYPELLKRAKEWVATMTRESLLKDEHKLFKITDFMEFINYDLLTGLYASSQGRIKPISHSTARSWLNRLGYYDTLKKVQLDQEQQEALQSIPEVLDRRKCSQGRKFGQQQQSRARSQTWSYPTPVRTTPGIQSQAHMSLLQQLLQSPSTDENEIDIQGSLNRAPQRVNNAIRGENDQIRQQSISPQLANLLNSDTALRPLNVEQLSQSNTGWVDQQLDWFASVVSPSLSNKELHKPGD
ncbi:hypothetical protein MIR68_007787 [Amoeboaphelidium protococcarum]|nr:hypothetical protein MIR68_007787 [Amoeboaphelidium protococcarum]